MTVRLSSETRFLAATLIDYAGTGFYLAVSAVYLTESVGLTRVGVGIALAAVGVVALVGTVPLGRLADRFGHRRGLIGLHVVRAASFGVLATSPSVAVVLVALSVLGLSDQAAAGVGQALAGDVAGSGGRVRLMARVRTVANLGITIGTLPAGLALAGGRDAFGVLLTADAVSYLMAAAIMATVPVVDRPGATRPRGLLVPSAATSALIVIDGVMSLWQVMLNVGMPLWVVQDTHAPRVMVAILYATNTVLCLALQIRLSHMVTGYRAAAVSQRCAGVALAVSCTCLAAAALASNRFTGQAAGA
jgi:MFS family permease